MKNNNHTFDFFTTILTDRVRIRVVWPFVNSFVWLEDLSLWLSLSDDFSRCSSSFATSKPVKLAGVKSWASLVTEVLGSSMSFILATRVRSFGSILAEIGQSGSMGSSTTHSTGAVYSWIFTRYLLDTFIKLTSPLDQNISRSSTLYTLLYRFQEYPCRSSW